MKRNCVPMRSSFFVIRSSDFFLLIADLRLGVHRPAAMPALFIIPAEPLAAVRAAHEFHAKQEIHHKDNENSGGNICPVLLEDEKQHDQADFNQVNDIRDFPCCFQIHMLSSVP